jgi:catechol 2,3-dioxygenase-like lactoylglutathione lyase family enzyme
MAVRRIVANLGTDRLDAAKAFYGEALGMEIVMNLGWIMTFAASGSTAPQISVATEGRVGNACARSLHTGRRPVGRSPEDAGGRVRDRIWSGN